MGQAVSDPRSRTNRHCTRLVQGITLHAIFFSFTFSLSQAQLHVNEARIGLIIEFLASLMNLLGRRTLVCCDQTTAVLQSNKKAHRNEKSWRHRKQPPRRPTSDSANSCHRLRKSRSCTYQGLGASRLELRQGLSCAFPWKSLPSLSILERTDQLDPSASSPSSSATCTLTFRTQRLLQRAGMKHQSSSEPFFFFSLCG